MTEKPFGTRLREFAGLLLWLALVVAVMLGLAIGSTMIP